ncbi:MAG: hypothetical protein ACRDPA_35090, partial [Solirubrobacteraceae bacterium]
MHGELGHAEVLSGDARGGVAHDERDVGALGGPARAQRGVVLDRLPHLGLAADPGGVDQDEL